MSGRYARQVPAQAPDFSRRRIIRRRKDSHDALLYRTLPLAIAATRGLRDLVEARFCAPYTREIEIDAGFDQGGGDDAAGLSFSSCSRILREFPFGGSHTGGW